MKGLTFRNSEILLVVTLLEVLLDDWANDTGVDILVSQFLIW